MTEPPKPLANTGDVALYLGIPPLTLVRWRQRRAGPTYSRVGRHIRYRWEDVDAWLAENANKPVRAMPARP